MTDHGAGISSHDSLRLLKEGNARYVRGAAEGPNRDEHRRLEASRHGQGPLAIILSCSDSRVPPEVLFDRGIGDLFIVRVAGNICDISQIGSIEYAVHRLHVPLLVIMGHSKCGAVTAVVEQEQVNGSVRAIAKLIQPAVEKIAQAKPGLSGDERVEECAKENVWQQIQDLLLDSSIVRDGITYGHLDVLGAYYDIENGIVTWMGKHPKEYELLNSISYFKRPSTL